MWSSPIEIGSKQWGKLGPVVDETGGSLNPEFAKRQTLAWDFATGLKSSMHGKTPVAWSRGLRMDGTWGADGVYGTVGGFIAFLGGNVQFFSDLGSMPLVPVSDGTPTSNILEALPNSARVVGAGPGTLHGMTGLAKE